MIAFCKFTVWTSPPGDSKTNSAKFVAGSQPLFYLTALCPKLELGLESDGITECTKVILFVDKVLIYFLFPQHLEKENTYYGMLKGLL